MRTAHLEHINVQLVGGTSRNSHLPKKAQTYKIIYV